MPKGPHDVEQICLNRERSLDFSLQFSHFPIATTSFLTPAIHLIRGRPRGLLPVGLKSNATLSQREVSIRAR